MKQTNRLENNYNNIKFYFRQLQKKQITAKEFNEKKKLLLEDATWKKEYNNLKGKKEKLYRDRAYVALFTLFYVIKAISREEFDFYSERLLYNKRRQL